MKQRQNQRKPSRRSLKDDVDEPSWIETVVKMNPVDELLSERLEQLIEVRFEF